MQLPKTHRGGDPQGSNQGSASLCKLRSRAIHVAQDLSRTRIERAAVLGQREFTGGALQKSCPEGSLQIHQPLADHGLGNAQASGCPAMEPVSTIDTNAATDSSLSIVRFFRNPDQEIAAPASGTRKSTLRRFAEQAGQARGVL